MIDEDGEAVEALDPRRVEVALDWSAGRLPGMTESKRWTGDQDVADTYSRMEGRGGAGARTIASLIKEAQANGYSGNTWGHLDNVARFYGSGGGGQGLALAVDNTEPDDIPEDGETEPQANRWAALTYRGDRIKSIKPPVPIIPGYLLSRGVTACLALRRTGKTVIVLDTGLSLANGTPWAGEKVAPDWHVVYLCGEDHENAAAHVQGWALTNNGGNIPARFTFMGDVPNLMAGDDDIVALADHVAGLVPEGARVVFIVDTWQRATTGGGQNDDGDMKAGFSRLEYLANRFRGPG